MWQDVRARVPGAPASEDAGGGGGECAGGEAPLTPPCAGPQAVPGLHAPGLPLPPGPRTEG